MSVHQALVSFKATCDSASYLQKFACIVGGALVVFGGVACYYLRKYLMLHAIPNYKEIAYPENVTNKALRVRFINLDGAMPLQKKLVEKYKPEVLDLKSLGQALRMDCWYHQFDKFEQELTKQTGSDHDIVKPGEPLITFYGSNDYHHLTLGIFRRIRTKVNLIMFDNHPDYIQYYPTGLHCGCWLAHAASFPNVNRCWHLGGFSGEFEDKTLRWYTPWSMMKDKKMLVHAAQENFKGMRWDEIDQSPLRKNSLLLVSEQRVRKLFEPYKEELAKYPLYITLDKDCMERRVALQNWNSGVLLRDEVAIVIKVLIEMSRGRLYAMDITGDFSPVKIKGVYRHFLHMAQHCHSENNIDPVKANSVNELTNRYLLRELSKNLGIENMQDPQPR